jgi:tRNA modification GTPase
MASQFSSPTGRDADTGADADAGVDPQKAAQTGAAGAPTRNMSPDRQDDTHDTIVAIATAPGRGGIGVVRLSGPAALTCARPLFAGLPAHMQPSHAYFCYLVEPATQQRLDEVLVTWFAAPRSYTGEDVVEVAAHGAPVLLRHLVGLLLAEGARGASPGEFTERAFLNGRLDLTQAEAVRDLVEAETMTQAQLAAQQLGGSLARSVGPSKDRLIALIALLEAGIDFAEDDTPVLGEAEAEAALLAIHAPLHALERSFTHGRLLTEGVTVAVVGRPNVGKSSLFNQLLGRDRAIVTDEAGTTRDTVEERVALSGIPISLVDTAGLRDAASEAERIGILKSREAFADAGLVLLVLDASVETWTDEEVELARAASGRPLIVVANKADLISDGMPDVDTAVIQGTLDDGASLPGFVASVLPADTPVLRTSALSGEGLDALRAAMTAMLTGSQVLHAGAAMLTNARQHASVAEAVQAVAQAMQANATGLPQEMVLLDLYAALRALDALTGVTTPDDVLNLVFSKFCIGK